jgi:flagellar biosynthesis protein FlhB
MADPSDYNRTYEPTERRVAQARSRGHVAVSRELSVGFGTLVACVGFIVAGKAAVGSLAVAMRDSLRSSMGTLAVRAAIGAGLDAAASALLLPMLAISVAALTIGLVQTRGLIRARLLPLDGRRIAPSLRRLWGVDKLGFAGKEVGRIAALLLVAVVSIGSSARGVLGLAGGSPWRILDALFVAAKNLGLALAFATLGLGVADYLWQLFRHHKALRMTQDEVRREHREIEGDPVFKAERRRIHAELSQAYALTELWQADLLLVEPGQAAAALRYAARIAEAPFVIAKGRNRLAQRMEAVATAAGVPIVVDPPLLAQLASTEAGEEIPEALYEAIAGLLAEAGGHRRENASGTEAKPDSSRIGR